MAQSYNNYHDEDAQPHHPWMQSLWEARRNAREAYAAIDPDTGNHRTVYPSDNQQLAHIFLVDYARHLRPLAVDDTNLQALWTDELASAEIPKALAVYDMQSNRMLYSSQNDTETGITTPEAVQHLETTEKPVSLKHVVTWWDTQNEIPFKVRAPSGTERRSITVYLPRGAIGLALQQADRCLENLNWLPSSAVTDWKAPEEDKVAHDE